MVGCVLGAGIFLAQPAAALYVPDSLFLFEGIQGIPGTTITPDFSSFQTIPIPESLVVEETNIFASSPPNGEEGGAFERNEYLARFKKTGEPAANNFGHRFQRSEDWDISFDFSIQSPHPEVRKEAGIYFEHNIGPSQLGNAIFNVASNDDFYSDGPGNIGVIFAPMIPAYSFSTLPGPLGDYNLNGKVDAADYTVWRDTLGSTEDFRANGNNEGDSEDLIDFADYEVWKEHFGEMTMGDAITYDTGDTINIRLIYTPPIVDPEIPFDGVNPGANVMTPGTMEYQITTQGGEMATSGPLEFTSSWMGIPNDTLISARVQNLSTLSVAPDSSTITFANFDFDGPDAGLGFAGGVPEPATSTLLAIGLQAMAVRRRRGRCV
jgi:hypothetical protein